jgi:hypothetical protein
MLLTMNAGFGNKHVIIKPELVNSEMLRPYFVLRRAVA